MEERAKLVLADRQATIDELNVRLQEYEAYITDLESRIASADGQERSEINAQLTAAKNNRASLKRQLSNTQQKLAEDKKLVDNYENFEVELEEKNQELESLQIHRKRDRNNQNEDVDKKIQNKISRLERDIFNCASRIRSYKASGAYQQEALESKMYYELVGEIAKLKHMSRNEYRVELLEKELLYIKSEMKKISIHFTKSRLSTEKDKIEPQQNGERNTGESNKRNNGDTEGKANNDLPNNNEQNFIENRGEIIYMENETGKTPNRKDVKWNKKLTPVQIEELIEQGVYPGDEEYDRFLWDYGINPNEKDNDENNLDKGIKWNKRLTPAQIEELIEQGVYPGDEEYDRFLWDYGINPSENENDSNEKNHENDIIEEPEEPYIPVRKKEQKNNDDIGKMKEEYDRLNDMYLDILEELEVKRNKLNSGEIPYEEYQKYAYYAIDKYKYMKDLYDKIENDIALAKEDKSVQEPVFQGKKEDKPKGKDADLPKKNVPTTSDTMTNSLNILYNAREGVYEYVGMVNGKQINDSVKAERNLFKKSKNKAILIEEYGEQGFEELFSGATAKAYKKCDVNVVKILKENFGVNAARDYLVELMNGKKGSKGRLFAKITYDLSELKIASKIQTAGGKEAKLSMFDRFRIKRNAKFSKYIATVIPSKNVSSLFKQYEQKALNEGSGPYKADLEEARTEFFDKVRVNVPVIDANTETEPTKQPEQPTKVNVNQGENPFTRKTGENPDKER